MREGWRRLRGLHSLTRVTAAALGVVAAVVACTSTKYGPTESDGDEDGGSGGGAAGQSGVDSGATGSGGASGGGGRGGTAGRGTGGGAGVGTGGGAGSNNTGGSGGAVGMDGGAGSDASSAGGTGGGGGSATGGSAGSAGSGTGGGAPDASTGDGPCIPLTCEELTPSCGRSRQLGCGYTMDCGTCASCTNGIHDTGETDVDCGGDLCGVCDLAELCEVDRDCSSNAQCVSGVCTTIKDRVQVDYVAIGTPDDDFVHFQIRLANRGPTVLQGPITMQYWWEDETLAYDVFDCVSGCANVDFGSSGSNGSWNYRGVRLNDLNLPPGDSTPVVEVRSRRGSVPQDETNDYSYDGTSTSLTANPHISVYRGGLVIWGEPPYNSGKKCLVDAEVECPTLACSLCTTAECRSQCEAILGCAMVKFNCPASGDPLCSTGDCADVVTRWGGVSGPGGQRVQQLASCIGCP